MLDTSAAVYYLVGGDPGEWVAEQLRQDPDVHAPHVLDVEVLGVVRRLLRLGELTERRARTALEDLGDLRIARYSHLPLLPRMWELRGNLSPRDAAFAALAEALGAPLLTTDVRLARAPGIRARVLVP